MIIYFRNFNPGVFILHIGSNNLTGRTEDVDKAVRYSIDTLPCIIILLTLLHYAIHDTVDLKLSVNFLTIPILEIFKETP